MVYYILDLSSENNETRRFVFQIESENRQRWAEMRLIQIQDKTSEGFQIENYDPDIHLPTGHHYMSNTWKARYIYVVIHEDFTATVESYWLISPFGNPGTKMPLFESDIILSLADE